MLSLSFFQFILTLCAVITITSLPAQASPVQNVRTLVLRDIIQSSCDSEQQLTINDALKEVKAMAEAMQSKCDDLVKWLKDATKDPSVPFIEGPVDANLYTAFKTFHVMFGRILWPPQDPKTYKRNFDGDGIKYVQQISDIGKIIAQNVQKFQSQQVALDFYCSDDWLKDKDDNGKTNSGSVSYLWDSRTDHIQPKQRTWIYVGSEGSCRNYPALQGQIFQHTYGIGGDVDVMMLCPKAWRNWKAAAQTLTASKGTAFPDGKNIDHLSRDVPSVLLFHELSHSREFMKGAPIAYSVDPNLEDYPKNSIAGRMNSPYNFNGVYTVARGPQGNFENQAEALAGAENIAYFATAMYLDKNDWSNKLARIPASWVK